MRDEGNICLYGDEREDERERDERGDETLIR